MGMSKQNSKKLLIVALSTILIICMGMAAVTSAQIVLDGFPTEKIAATPEIIEAGKPLYKKRCSFCHGDKGAGDGSVADYLEPRPRDFTSGAFKFRTTSTGEVPIDEDIFRVITRGVPGTSMPSWGEVFTEEERWQLVHYIKTFSEDFADFTEEDYNEIKITIGKEMGATSETIAEGKKLYEKMKCWECHGQQGRGDGPSSGTHKDDWGYPTWPFNLTRGWKYRGGNTPKDIYIRFTTGVNYTPMPSYADNLSDEERWQLAHYIGTLIKEEEKAGSDVVLKSTFLTEDVPDDPNDSRWEKAEPIEIALSGQIIAKPRWQNPSIDSITVSSLYNKENIAFLLEWDDRKKDGSHKVGEYFSDSDEEIKYTYVKVGSVRPEESIRDAVAIQFPVKIPEGPEKPYFLRGQSGKIVNLLTWKADWQDDPKRGTSVEEVNASGYKKPPVPQSTESQQAKGNGIWKDGKWKVVITRALTTEDKGKDIQFERGRLIPIAFNAWDGSKGERGLKMSISSWYYLLLETSAPFSVYLYALIGIVLASGFEMWLIRRLRKRGNKSPR